MLAVLAGWVSVPVPGSRAAPAAADSTESAGGLFAGDLFSAKGGPIDIRAESFVLKNLEHLLEYQGNVEATQADSTLRCQTLALRYGEDHQIREGTCDGDVKFTSGDRVVTAGKARLDRIRHILTLIKDVRVWQGENEMQGEQAKLFLAEDRMVVEGSAEHPVRTTVQSSGTSAISFEPPQIGGGGKPAKPGAAKGDNPESKLPLKVRAQRFEAERGKHQAVYEGGVVAERGDVTLTCETLVLGFDQANREVAWADAKGGVQIVQLDRTVNADTGHFTKDDQRVLLEGKPAVARRGPDELKCLRIAYDRVKDELRCEGARQQRVETNIQSGGVSGGSGQVVPRELIK